MTRSGRIMVQSEEVLNSWKEIAAYLGRGVRTVQRWEQELGLPVRRPRGKSRSAVIAFKGELDKWLHQAPAEQLRGDDADEALPLSPLLLELTSRQRPARLHQNTELLISRTQSLLTRSKALCERLQKNVNETLTLSTAAMKSDWMKGKIVAGPPPADEVATTLKGGPHKQAIAS
jgi:phage terminase Nu1 subunit (DNA packaging protein)